MKFENLDQRTFHYVWPETQVLMDLFHENPTWRVHFLDEAHVATQVNAHYGVARRRYKNNQWGRVWEGTCSVRVLWELRLPCDCYRCQDDWWANLKYTKLYDAHLTEKERISFYVRGDWRLCQCNSCRWDSEKFDRLMTKARNARATL